MYNICKKSAKIKKCLGLKIIKQKCIDNRGHYKLCVNARNKVVREFDSKIVIKKYIQLYEKIKCA